MRFLYDTDHISILQRQAGPEFAALLGRIARQQPADLAFSVVSFHEQVLGCHTYLSRARTSADGGWPDPASCSMSEATVRTRGSGSTDRARMSA